MTHRLRIAMLLGLATTAMALFTPTAGATPTVLDSSCSASADICTSILLSKKNKQVKFEILSSTAAVQGAYTLCVKGPHGKECKDFVLEQLPDEEIWADKVNWQKNFNDDVGSYVVKWKYMGDRISEKLRFDVGQQGEAKRPNQIDDYCSPSGDICQEITMSKHGGRIKFGLYSFTSAVQGEYTLCVKGIGSKECRDFELELQAADALIYADRVNWADNFPATRSGPYIVKWKYQGEKLGKKLHFEIGPITTG